MGGPEFENAECLTASSLVWTGERIEVRELELPEVGAGEVLVRVDFTTVCGSDRHTVLGRRDAAAPSILGHEAVGTVIRAGDGTGLQIGARVTFAVTVPCHNCSRCAAGRTAKCARVRKVGHEPLNADWPLSGTYSTNILLPAGATIVEVPTSLPDEVAAPTACAAATIMAAIEQAGSLRGASVLISGAGMLGLVAAAAAANAGASDVTVIDPLPERREQALRFGATQARPPGTPLHGVDIAFEVSGSSAAAQHALDSLGTYGKLILVGAVAPDAPLSLEPERVVRHWLTVTGVHNYEPKHLEDAILFLVNTEHRFPWKETVLTVEGLTGIAASLAPDAEAPTLVGITRIGARPNAIRETQS